MLLIIQSVLSLGLIFSLLTFGVHLTFRVLEIPDLSVEGTIILGAAMSASLIHAGFSPFIATMLSMLVGCLGGLATGLLHTKCKIPPILAGILTMIASYSIVLRILGMGTPTGIRSNVTLVRIPTVFDALDPIGLSGNSAVIVISFAFLALCGTLLYCFYGTEIGAALRATGNNRQMAKAQGVNTDIMIILGLVVANGFVGLAGGLWAQQLGFADVSMGGGIIVIGLASVIIAEVLFRVRRFWVRMLTLVLGSTIYRAIIALVLEMGLAASDLRLFTAITVAVALSLPMVRDKFSYFKKRRAS